MQLTPYEFFAELGIKYIYNIEMVVYDIVIDDTDLTMYPEEIRDDIDNSILFPNTILFITSNIFEPDTPLTSIGIRFGNSNIITHIRDSYIEGDDLPLSGIEVKDYRTNDITQLLYNKNLSLIKIVLGNIELHENLYLRGDTAAERREYRNNTFMKLRTYISKLRTNRRQINLNLVEELGEHRGLPHNVEGKIGEFLSGYTGHIPHQRNQLNQNLGISLAPRVRAGTKRARLEGGKRKTRKY